MHYRQRDGRRTRCSLSGSFRPVIPVFAAGMGDFILLFFLYFFFYISFFFIFLFFLYFFFFAAFASDFFLDYLFDSPNRHHLALHIAFLRFFVLFCFSAPALAFFFCSCFWERAGSLAGDSVLSFFLFSFVPFCIVYLEGFYTTTHDRWVRANAGRCEYTYLYED